MTGTRAPSNSGQKVTPDVPGCLRGWLSPFILPLKQEKEVMAFTGACASVHTCGHVCVCTLEPPLPPPPKNMHSTCSAVTLTDEMES
jgi:hypothetical protein